MSGTLDGKRALVTGASSGIGLATALLFERNGAAVVGLDRRWSAPVQGIDCVEGDVTSGADVASAVERASGGEGLDILIANAGVHVQQEWLTADLDAWSRLIEVNLIGVMRCFQAAAADMIRHGRKGRLLATTSVAGLRSFAEGAAYCASKAGAISVVKSAALALTPHQITVNSVAPGNVDTEMQSQAIQEAAASSQREAKDIRQESADECPMRRMARPEEIAAAFLYLASDAAAYTTGETITVDGGMMLV